MYLTTLQPYLPLHQNLLTTQPSGEKKTAHCHWKMLALSSLDCNMHIFTWHIVSRIKTNCCAMLCFHSKVNHRTPHRVYFQTSPKDDCTLRKAFFCSWFCLKILQLFSNNTTTAYKHIKKNLNRIIKWITYFWQHSEIHWTKSKYFKS